VGWAEIAFAAIDTAHIGDAQVNTLKIAGESVVVPRALGYPQDQGVAADAPEVMFGRNYAVCNMELTADVRAVFATYTFSLRQAAVNNGAVIQIWCFLNARSGRSWPIQTFQVGISNNNPQFAQCATFLWGDVAADGYWFTIVAQQASGQPVNNIFSNQSFFVWAGMR
jgi:hypothetical protein